MSGSQRSTGAASGASPSGMINKIQKAREYAGKPERIHFRELQVEFDGRNGQHSVDFHDGEWHCDCAYFRNHHVCSHTMAMERVLGVMAPTEDDASQHPDSWTNASGDVRGSLAARVQRWVAGSLSQMNDEEVLKLVQAQSAEETVAELLVATPETRRARGGDWTELLMRGAQAKSRIAELAGGLMSPLEVARVLNISVPGVKQRLERRKLLAVTLPGGQKGFPALQFEHDGRVREGVPEVVAAGARIDSWALLGILVDEVEDQDGGTLLERLGDQEVRTDVLGRLASYGEHGAA